MSQKIVAIAAVVAVGLSGCASIVMGGSQSVLITTPRQSVHVGGRWHRADH
jgi:hypothetical protein